MSPRRFALSLVLMLALFAGCKRQAPTTPELTIAAASVLRFAMEDLVADFQVSRPEGSPSVNIRVSYGSSGNFFAQFSQRAPFDLFFSADMLYPTRMVEDGLALDDSLFSYASGRIVVWVPSSSKLNVDQLKWDTLKDVSVRRIAIANPEHAPYGKAAAQAMRSAGIHDEVLPKLVYGENIAQTAQFVESGAAEVGIIALALALSPVMKTKGRFWEIPPEDFSPMMHGGVVTKWARHPELALEFRSYVLGTRGRAILKSYGFQVERNDST